MTKKEFTIIEQIMKNEMSDSAHDTEHVYRVIDNALFLAQDEKIDFDVLITACLLHDIGRKEQNENPSLCHAKVGAKKASEILKSLGKDNNFIAKVVHCIETHRFRKNLEPQTIEAKILFDADKLDVTGAIGIARTLMYQGMKGYSLNGEENSFFTEYEFKLSKIDDMFFTKRGKEEAKKRGITRDFFHNALKAELVTNNLNDYLK